MRNKLVQIAIYGLVIPLLLTGIVKAIEIKLSSDELKELVGSEQRLGGSWTAQLSRPVVPTDGSTATSSEFIGDVIPVENDNYDLGEAGQAWRNIYTAGTLYVSSTVQSGDLLPDITDLRDIGNGLLSWRNIFASGTAYIGTDTIINGDAGTTSTFGYGATFATTGGNIGIGTAAGTDFVTIKPSASGEGLVITEAGDVTTRAVELDGNTASGVLRLYSGGSVSHSLLGAGSTVFNQTNTVLDFTIRSQSNPYMFFVDGSANTLNVGIAGTSPYLMNLYAHATTTPLLAIGNGSATTTLSGGTAGNATSTFAGDVDISDLYMGMIDLTLDGGMLDFMNISVSADPASSTIEGYNFLVDGIPALTVGALADSAGQVNSWGIGVNTSTPSLAEYALSIGGNAYIDGDLKVTGSFSAGKCHINLAATTTQAIGTASTPQDVIWGESSSEHCDWLVTDGTPSATATIPRAGTYSYMYCLEPEKTTGGTVAHFEYALFSDSILEDLSQGEIGIKSNNETTPACWTHINEQSLGDEITLKMGSDSTNIRIAPSSTIFSATPSAGILTIYEIDGE